MDMDKVNNEVSRLLKIMETLRGPNGSPWDRKQDYQSLQPYIIEEAYEVIEAIQMEDLSSLKEELGDLLLQVVFQAQLGRENGDFDFADIVYTINEKLLRRHPHVFNNLEANSVEDVRVVWDKIKKEEKINKGYKIDEEKSILDDINGSQPALNQAYEIQKRAAEIGFDWNDIADVIGKVKEELEELEEAMSNGNEIESKKELGDLLFSVVNLSRFLNIHPELALFSSNLKFKQRFKFIENSILEDGKNIEDLKLAELDYYWEKAKEIEKQGEEIL
ncbi:MAG: nucleoside triphosphate pyrophosphohydrolase [Bacillota bacterium]